MKARVIVTPRLGVLDPQGRAVLGSLHSLGFPEVSDVRIGRFIELEILPGGEPAGSGRQEPGPEGHEESGGGRERERAELRLDEMCRRLLANTLIEDYRFEIEP